MPTIQYVFLGEYSFCMSVGDGGSRVRDDYMTLADAASTGFVRIRPGPPPMTSFRIYTKLVDRVPTGEYELRTPFIKVKIAGRDSEGEYAVMLMTTGGDAAEGVLGRDAARLQMIPNFGEGELRMKFLGSWVLVANGKFSVRTKDDMFTQASWKVRQTLGPSYAKADLRLVDFRGPYMRGNTDFTEANLGKAQMEGAFLLGSKFNGADFNETKCAGAMFGNLDSVTSLKKAKFNKTDLGGTDFVRCDLSEAEFVESTFSATTSFRLAKLRGAKFVGASLAGADFLDADLTGADFTRANFGNANLSGAILTGAILDDADLRTVQFTKLPRFYDADAPVDAKKASLKRAKLKAGLLGSDWSRIDLNDATVEDIPVTISKLQAKNSLLGPLNFASKTLVDADFTGSTLKNIDFTGATLTGAVMPGIDLRTTTLTRVDLTGADLSRANLREKTIEGAILTRVKMLGTDCAGAKLSTCTAAEPGVFTHDPAQQRTSFAGAEIPYALLKLNWEALDLRNVTIANLPQDLTKLNANHALLRSINLVDRILEKANFDNAQLTGGLLSSTNLTNATFIKAFLQGEPPVNACDLSGAFMKKTDFTGANLTGVGASSCCMFEATLAQSTMIACIFTNAYLASVNFSGVKDNAMQGVNFSRACLVNAIFKGVKFSNYKELSCSLVEACLQGANFQDALLSGVFMRNAAIALEKGKIEVTRIIKYKDTPMKTTLGYEATTIDPAAATSVTTVCPNGSNGPCIGDKLTSPAAPTIWPKTSQTETE